MLFVWLNLVFSFDTEVAVELCEPSSKENIPLRIFNFFLCVSGIV